MNMLVKTFHLTLILVLVLIQISKEYRFSRKIDAIGRPFYKIIMALGACKVLIQISKEYRFSRKIDAIGRPFYKIIMALGACKVLIQISKEYRFSRKIDAIGRPFYKIIMALGACKETVLFLDQKIWEKNNLNRVLDIYYKCDNERYKVSRVEITLVINNTSSYAHSEEGVGYSEFAATLYLPTNINFVVYALTIYSCYRERESAEITYIREVTEQTLQGNQSPVYMPFLQNYHQQSD